MIIVDSSVLIGLAIRTDAQHDRAETELSEISDSIGIPNAVLVETALALWRLGHNAEFMAEWIQQIQERFEVVIEPAKLIQNSIQRYARHATRLSIVDCQLIEWAKTEGAQVLTFDEEINRELQRT